MAVELNPSAVDALKNEVNSVETINPAETKVQETAQKTFTEASERAENAEPMKELTPNVTPITVEAPKEETDAPVDTSMAAALAVKQEIVVQPVVQEESKAAEAITAATVATVIQQETVAAETVKQEVKATLAAEEPVKVTQSVQQTAEKTEAVATKKLSKKERKKARKAAKKEAKKAEHHHKKHK